MPRNAERTGWLITAYFTDVETFLRKSSRPAGWLADPHRHPDLDILPAPVRPRNRCSSLRYRLRALDRLWYCGCWYLLRRRFVLPPVTEHHSFDTADCRWLAVGTWFAFKYAFRRKAEM